MGSGKGAVDYWVATVKPGTILFEIGSVPDKLHVLLLISQHINCQLKQNLLLETIININNL